MTAMKYIIQYIMFALFMQYHDILPQSNLLMFNKIVSCYSNQG